MKTAIQETAFSGISIPGKTETAIQLREQGTKPNHESHSLAYFMWVYVAIFSTIMVAVIIAERFFIQ